MLGGAVLLLAVLGVFIGSARYLRHHFLAKLPAKLGIDIKSETNGFTYSQSVQGRTVYTLHAAKEVEHNDGTITLHDVNMVLYGPRQDRADRISGSDFEVDQNAGLIRAMGLVHIDMQAAQPPTQQPPKSSLGIQDERPAASDAKILHATTSGLVYMEKLGVAATAEPIEFHLGQMTGHATGADYNTDTGQLMLHSSVSMTGIAGTRPIVLTASAAEIDNREQQTFLTHAKYISLGQTVEAEQSTVHTRTDGTVSRIVAQGNVTASMDGGTVVSQHADVTLNAKSQPESAILTGSVLYSADEPLRQARGQGDTATILFDKQPQPQPQHAVFTGSVHIIERIRATESDKEPWSVRDLTAARLDVALVSIAGNRSELRDADASGAAHLTVVDNGSLARPVSGGRTDLAADDLKAHLIHTGDAKQPARIDTVAGRGHTVLHSLGADGIEQTSLGESLDAKFRPAAPAAQPPATPRLQLADTLLSAVQQGHVTITRRVPPQSKAKSQAKAAVATPTAAPPPDDIQNASADRAIYDGDLDHFTLSGGAQVSDSGSELWANQVVLERKTGDTHATGAVKVNYATQPSKPASGATARPSADSEPAHVLADRADMNHATDVTTFYGKPVRLWQGASQVQAPIIEMATNQRRMTARGDATGPPQVHTVLVSTPGDAGPSNPAPPAISATKVAAEKTTRPPAASRGPQVVRIASRELVYSDTTRQAVFSGGVRSENVDGTMLAREATVFLAPASAPATPSAPFAGAPSIEGRVEKVVATGNVEIEQPGRRATGQRLVYTASDGLYVLTGDATAPPRAVDTLQGTSFTGAALLFHSGDESVVVSGSANDSTTGERVRTDAKVKK